LSRFERANALSPDVVLRLAALLPDGVSPALKVWKR